MNPLRRALRALVLALYLPQVESVREAACGGATPCAAPDEADAAEREIRAQWLRRVRVLGLDTHDLETRP